MHEGLVPDAFRVTLARCSFGSTAAIVTSVGLIVGFGAATVSRPALVSALFSVAFADNISDSLSIHIYQESENLEERAAFRATVTNFFARLPIALSFVSLVLLLPRRLVSLASALWGLLLLGTLPYVLARARKVRPLWEILTHFGVAVLIVLVSRTLGLWINTHVH
jgi:hypothetical protein